MSFVVEEMAKTLENNGFELEDVVEIFGKKAFHLPLLGEICLTEAKREFKLNDERNIDRFFVECSTRIFEVTYNTKDGKILRYVPDNSQPFLYRRWNLKEVASRNGTYDDKKISKVIDISI